MQWNDQYTTGIQEIDEQHKMLFLMTNRLQTAIKTGKANLVIAKTFKELIDYTKYHFAAEEQEMDGCDYPDALIHKRFHAILVKKIRDALLRIRNGDNYNPIELLRFLNVWLVDHILEKDMKFSKYYKQSSRNDSSVQLTGVTWLSTRLQKLRDLLKRKLIEMDVYINEKKKILNGFIDAHTTWNEAELKSLCDTLPTFIESQFLSESEVVQLKSQLSQKIDFGKLLDCKSETDAQNLLAYLREQRVITSP
jgi:hemerythrin-like metal-binding protein